MPELQRLQLAQVEVCDNIEGITGTELKQHVAAAALHQIHVTSAAPLALNHRVHARARACILDASRLDGEFVACGTVDLQD